MHRPERDTRCPTPKHVEPRNVRVALVVDEGALVEQTAASQPPLPAWPWGRHDAIAVQLLLANQGSQLI